MSRPLSAALLFAAAVLASVGAMAQQSERFGPYELHYSVVNTSFLAPEVAAQYGIVRGKKRAILNLAVREHVEGGASEARTMQIKGHTKDLIQAQDLSFQEVREGPAIYYLAPFKFINREWRFFKLHFRPEGATETYTFEFKHQLYVH